ncbi:hypothetical protein [Corallococcus caeni]|uniref:Uncharacterized protein n=1 Tax=Corallococcus caeni TaxID=3082388 RepID=A0ABQ6QR08_9BACT|nr:hypothetical protein ASNO1_27110 [Corallococcus sp. NO1]
MAARRSGSTKTGETKKAAALPGLALKGGSFGLQTIGDIYYDLAPAGAHPIVVGVVLNAPKDEHPLTLAPGRYDYRFDIRMGSGNIQLSIRHPDGVEVQQKPFSSDSPLALHYRFKVP